MLIIFFAKLRQTRYTMSNAILQSSKINLILYHLLATWVWHHWRLVFLFIHYLVSYDCTLVSALLQNSVIAIPKWDQYHEVSIVYHDEIVNQKSHILLQRWAENSLTAMYNLKTYSGEDPWLPVSGKGRMGKGEKRGDEGKAKGEKSYQNGSPERPNPYTGLDNMYNCTWRAQHVEIAGDYMPYRSTKSVDLYKAAAD